MHLQLLHIMTFFYNLERCYLTSSCYFGVMKLLSPVIGFNLQMFFILICYYMLCDFKTTKILLKLVKVPTNNYLLLFIYPFNSSKRLRPMSHSKRRLERSIFEVDEFFPSRKIDQSRNLLQSIKPLALSTKSKQVFWAFRRWKSRFVADWKRRTKKALQSKGLGRGHVCAKVVNGKIW